MDPFYQAVAGDPILADLTARLRGVRAPVTLTVFEALTDSIIEQQISLKAAHSIENRLIRAVGKQLVLDGTVYYCYPDPEILATTADSTFRACGLTIRKGNTSGTYHGLSLPETLMWKDSGSSRTRKP